MQPSEQEVDRLAELIWEYHHLHHALQPADCILALGSLDTQVAMRAAELYRQGLAPLLVCSGGLGKLSAARLTKPEARIFADIAIAQGVPAEHILIEDTSTNTGENIRFSQSLLQAHGLEPNRLILVQKPYMERRTYATFMRQWPGKEIQVTSPQIGFAEYTADPEFRTEAINLMVGDLQRIRDYPALGFQIPQAIPSEVWRAYERLVELGYDSHLIKTT